MSSSMRLPTRSMAKYWIPVTLPPGRARLLMMPMSTMSPLNMAMTGIVLVSGATAMSTAPCVMRMSGLLAIISAVSLAVRSRS